MSYAVYPQNWTELGMLCAVYLSSKVVGGKVFNNRRNRLNKFGILGQLPPCPPLGTYASNWPIPNKPRRASTRASDQPSK